MRDKLLETLMRIVELLRSCGERTRAEWFREKLAVLEGEHSESQRFQDAIRELRGVLAGMGSLSDLSLNPTLASGLTRQEARDQQWELVDDLGDTIADLLSPST
jgi:hypothetical protein